VKITYLDSNHPSMKKLEKKTLEKENLGRLVGEGGERKTFSLG